MKVRKIQLLRLLQTMMESYNAFTTVESLDRKVEAWYDKLQYQNEEFVTKVMNNWNGTKIPTAVEILKKCFDLHAEQKNSYPVSDLICEYSKYSHGWEDECEVSKSLCKNHDPEKSNCDLISVELNENIFTVCWFHNKKIRSIFSTSEYEIESNKIFVDGIMSARKISSSTIEEWFKRPIK